MRWPLIRRVCLVGVPLFALAMPTAGHAQMDSREGIALQNQIYQLRQDLQIMRADIARAGGGGGGAGNGDAAQLLPRVQAMEEQVRQLRGKIDETQNLVIRQNAELSKRIDDLTFQLNLPGKSGALAPSAAPVPAPPQVREVMPRPPPPSPEPMRTAEAPPREAPPREAPPRETPPREAPPRPAPPPQLATPTPLPAIIPPPAPPPQSFTFNQIPEPMRETPPPPARVEPPKPAPHAAGPAPKPAAPLAETTQPEPTEVVAVIPPGGKRTPELALQEGHAALARRDYAAAERSAREVMANRASPRAYDGQFLLAQALAGEKQFAQAAIAYDDTYNRSHKGRHAQDALLGLAGALTAISEKKAACDTLNRMRTEFPQVRADLQESITKTNERAACGR